MLTQYQLRTDIVAKGFVVRQAAVSAQLLDAVRTEAIGLVDVFYAGDRSWPDYWSYPIAGRDSPVLYRIHNLERNQASPRYPAPSPTARCTASRTRL